MWVDVRATHNFGFLVGKKFSQGNVMICRENNKNHRPECFGLKGVRIWKVREI